jgi:putative transposase
MARLARVVVLGIPHYVTQRGNLDQPLADETLAAIRSGERTGRPLGSDSFVANLEAAMGRKLARQRPGRKPTAPRTTNKYV